MTADIRIATDLTTHPKTRLLIRRVGERGFRALLTLWSYAANNRPDGDLAGMDDDAIAAASDWPEDRAGSEWVDALAAVGFLDGEPGAYTLHDWVESQPWIAERAARQERARELVAIRWAKRRTSETDTARNTARNTPRTENGYGAQYSQPNPTQPRSTPQPPLQGGIPVGMDDGVETSQPQGARRGKVKVRRTSARDLVGTLAARPEPRLTPEQDAERLEAMKAAPCPMCGRPMGEPLTGFDRRLRAADLSADGYPLHCNAGPICQACDAELQRDKQGAA